MEIFVQCTKDDVTLNNYLARSRTACKSLATLASQTCGLRLDLLEVWCPRICPVRNIKPTAAEKVAKPKKEKKDKSGKKDKPAKKTKKTKKTKKDK